MFFRRKYVACSCPAAASLGVLSLFDLFYKASIFFIGFKRWDFKFVSATCDRTACENVATVRLNATVSQGVIGTSHFSVCVTPDVTKTEACFYTYAPADAALKRQSFLWDRLALRSQNTALCQSRFLTKREQKKKKRKSAWGGVISTEHALIWPNWEILSLKVSGKQFTSSISAWMCFFSWGRVTFGKNKWNNGRWMQDEGGRETEWRTWWPDWVKMFPSVITQTAS